MDISVYISTYIYIRLYMYVAILGKKNRETMPLSLQACFVIAYPSEDFIVKNILTIASILYKFA